MEGKDMTSQQNSSYPLLVFRKRKESFVGVERKKSGTAAPTKRIDQNRIFKFELTKQSSGMIPETSAVGEAIASKPTLTTNSGVPEIENTNN